MKNQIKYEIISIEEREIWGLEDVKNYLRVSHKNDDKLIGDLIKAATGYAEKFLGTGFFTKKIKCIINSAPSYFRVKYKPILKLDKVYLVKRENKEDITEDFGHVDFEQEKIWIDQNYWYQKLEINYESGFGQNIPSTILQGILMHVANMYDLGESVLNISSEIREIYLPYRAIRV